MKYAKYDSGFQLIQTHGKPTEERWDMSEVRQVPHITSERNHTNHLCLSKMSAAFEPNHRLLSFFTSRAERKAPDTYR